MTTEIEVLTFQEIDGRSICDYCGGTVVHENIAVPCCGGQFECVDYNNVWTCESCGRETSDW